MDMKCACRTKSLILWMVTHWRHLWDQFQDWEWEYNWNPKSHSHPCVSPFSPYLGLAFTERNHSLNVETSDLSCLFPNLVQENCKCFFAPVQRKVAESVPVAPKTVYSTLWNVSIFTLSPVLLICVMWHKQGQCWAPTNILHGKP